jgi:hypothetical protein
MRKLLSSFALVLSFALIAQTEPVLHGLPAPYQLGTGTRVVPSVDHLSVFSTALPLADLARMHSPWSYERLGVFCKFDVQLERRIGLPIFFRLGDVQQVEAWEGNGPLAPLNER